ncbi:Eco29kI family restriction endonuclease [bacterium]|nr:MAG: Eco29kI family restriction endonuclease [bacterium]
MCDRHGFQFDVDKAYEDQLVSVLEASPEHPLSTPEAPRQPGIYVLFRRGLPVYVGQAQELRSRLNDHLKKIDNRKGISASEVSCRFLTIDRMWEVARAEDALIRRYDPEWNGIAGFSMHVPGRGRPGMPGYVNEWDKRFPPRRK